MGYMRGRRRRLRSGGIACAPFKSITYSRTRVGAQTVWERRGIYLPASRITSRAPHETLGVD